MDAKQAKQLRDPFPGSEARDMGFDTPCWIWTRAINSNGYGSAWRADKGAMGAHRFVYEQLVGPVADGLELDHLCRVRRCVNPDHLEPVTRAENVRRGSHGKLEPHEQALLAHSTGPVTWLAEEFGVHFSWVYKLRKRRERV